MIQNHALAWVAVLAMGLIVMLHSIVLFMVFSQIGKRLREAQPALTNLISRVNSGTTALRQLLAHVETVPEKLAGVGDRSPAFLSPIRQAIERTDQAAAVTMSTIRSYLQKIDRGADNVLSNFSTQTFRVHRAVVHPAIRLSGILQSASSVLGRVMNRGKSPASYSSDEEIFI